MANVKWCSICCYSDPHRVCRDGKIRCKMRKPVFLMSADERITALGFRKVQEHPLCVQYERENTEFGYTEVFEFGHKKSGRHLVFLYEKKTNSDGFSNVIGMTEQELKAAVKKLKELEW